MVHRHRFIIGAFLLSILPAFSKQASAAMMRWEFDGVINHVYDPDGFFGGDILEGDLVTGQYIFDSTTPDSKPGDPLQGLYISPLASFSLTLGGQTFATIGTNCQIYVLDGTVDAFQLSGGFFDTNGLREILMGLALSSNNNTILNSDSLPIWPIEPYSFEYKGCGMKGITGNNVVEIFGVVTSLTLVPDPGSILLLCLGAFLAASHRVRRSVIK